MRPLLFVLFLFVSCSVAAQATISFHNDSLKIVFQGQTVFKGFIKNTSGKKLSIQNNKSTSNGAVQQVFSISSGISRWVDLSGEITGGSQSIACESEPRDNYSKVVRHSVGPSVSLLNHAVYDREADWLLSFDVGNPKVTIQQAKAAGSKWIYPVSVYAWEIVIRFRPDYFKNHRGLKYFNPREYRVWSKPLVGWCSWFAYFDEVNEKNISDVVAIAEEKLKPYGLEYIQIDDGYQIEPKGTPAAWLKGNKKFPQGLKVLADEIKQHGFKPGIWTNVQVADSAEAYQNKNLFVRDSNGNPARGNWIDYILDGSNPQTIRTYVSPLYDGLKLQGWQYVKLDALRHLRYEGYNAHASYFQNKKIDRQEAFRNIVKSVRKSLGQEIPLLACWGIRPELIGVVDACRIGNDGYSYAGLAQFNSFNNLIWRNDPDHIVLSDKEAYRSCTATSLTGSLFMLTDKAEKYNSGLVEAARRTMPVLFTMPGQVYDVDPSRSSQLNWVDAEISGSGPRPFDASSVTTTGLFLQEISRPYENWSVLGRMDQRNSTIPLADLGLNSKKEYIVFEFWTKQFKGTIVNQFEPEPIDPRYNCQVFCFRELQNHPQLLATNRHISCGGVELEKLQWADNALSGTSTVLAVENYIIYLHEPGTVQPQITADNAAVFHTWKEGAMRTVEFKPEKGATKISWKIQY
ncbi:MAG: alpha-galactosidase [Bacteroidetes bacterium]|nr:alpha-galactosidase [Bacteroidota bacterium]MBS1539177.1 alpha-galactosidase [Bacteroidota bacterium]